MRGVLSVLFVASSLFLHAQADPALKANRPVSLRERYQELKTSSETFNEYKVIKAYKLDQEWKIFLDSIEAVRSNLRQAQSELLRMETSLRGAQDTLKAREESITPLQVAGSHINFAGIDFRKGTFITTVLIVIAGLAALAGIFSWRLKMMQNALGDRVRVIDDINREFEEYKRKALDKQTKLSRELQNERNRLMESKNPKSQV